jgi:hypothetical protein
MSKMPPRKPKTPPNHPPWDAVRQIKPAQVPIDPPDIAPPNSILQYTAPTYDDVHKLTDGDLSQVMNVVEMEEVERRITLIARLIIEKALWNKDKVMSMKERADLAIKAIATIEGTKNRLWIRDDAETMPRSEEELQAEIDASTKRLKKILNEEKRLGGREKKRIEAAVRVAEAQAQRGQTENDA